MPPSMAAGRDIERGDVRSVARYRAAATVGARRSIERRRRQERGAEWMARRDVRSVARNGWRGAT